MGALADIAKTYEKSRIGVIFNQTHERLKPHGCKTVTHREWSQKHYMTMTRYMKTGDVLPVFDKQPSLEYAKQLGWLRILNLTKTTLELTQEDCNLEGYPELTPSQFRAIFYPDKAPGCKVIRVEFEFEPLELHDYEI